MSQLFVDNIKGRTGGAIGAPSGVNASGIVTATGLDLMVMRLVLLQQFLAMFRLVAH